MKRVLLISLCSLLGISCSSLKIDNIPKSAFKIEDHHVENTYFKQIGEEHLFRANIKVFKNELSGLFVVKRMNDSLHRVVLTSDFGNTLFDFSINKASYHVNYVMKDLDKKVILSILAKDFSFLVATNFEMNSIAQTKEQFIYQGKFQNYRTVIKQNQSTKAVEQVLRTSKRKVKVAYNYMMDKDGKLVIEHYNFPLTINLVPLIE